MGWVEKLLQESCASPWRVAAVISGLHLPQCTPLTLSRRIFERWAYLPTALHEEVATLHLPRANASVPACYQMFDPHFTSGMEEACNTDATTNLTFEDMKKQKKNALTGKTDTSTTSFGEESSLCFLVVNLKPQAARFLAPGGHDDVLAVGRLLHPGCVSGDLPFVVSCSPPNQVLGRLGLPWNTLVKGDFKNDEYCCHCPRRKSYHGPFEGSCSERVVR